MTPSRPEPSADTKAREIAYRVASLWNFDPSPDWNAKYFEPGVLEIAAALLEHGEECVRRWKHQSVGDVFHSDIKKAYAQGFSDCRERAAKICDSRAEMRDTYECDCRGYTRASEHDAEEIRALRAEGEKDTTPSEGGTK
jgi:hypothetical protein